MDNKSIFNHFEDNKINEKTNFPADQTRQLVLSSYLTQFVWYRTVFNELVI